MVIYSVSRVSFMDLQLFVLFCCFCIVGMLDGWGSVSSVGFVVVVCDVWCLC